MKNVDLKTLTPRPFYFNGVCYPVDRFIQKINWLSAFQHGDIVFFSYSSDPNDGFYLTTGRFKRDGRFKKTRNLNSHYLKYNKNGFYQHQKFLFIRFGIDTNLIVSSNKKYNENDWCSLAFPVLAYVMSLTTGKFYCVEDFPLFQMKKI